MADKTVRVYNLAEKSLTSITALISAFKEKHLRPGAGESAEKKADKADVVVMESLRDFVMAGTETSAAEALRTRKEAVKLSLTDEQLKRDLEACVLRTNKGQDALVHEIEDADDFTFYLEEDEQIAALLRLMRGGASYVKRFGALPQAAILDKLEESHVKVLTSTMRQRLAEDFANKHLKEENRFSYDQELWLWDERDGGKAARGRALACPCGHGKKWSVTFRVVKVWPDKRPTGLFLNKIDAISNVLWELIFKSGVSEEHGLVVITGRTAACKSQIAHKLIESYLSDKNKSNMHFPTYEDPIEHTFNIPNVRYTPREKGKDVSNLEEALHNALRQKPTVFFVGETRNPKDWDILLKFAGTGHLVVTTAHAGSLIEAMGNILQATQAHDPTARSIVGGRLLALIHLKPERIDGVRDPKTSVGILVPALWRRTSEGVKALMSEGLSSLMPNTPGRLPLPGTDRPKRKEKHPASIGRYWFARELLNESRLLPPARLALADHNNQVRTKEDEVKTLALEWDLEGI